MTLSSNHIGIQLMRFTMILGLALVGAHAVFASDSLSILADKNTLNGYIQFLDGRDPRTIDRYDGEEVGRDSIDLVLVQQALYLGGMTKKTRFVVMPSYTRSLYALVNGDYPISGETVWSMDIEEHKDALLAGDPVIREGEYEAGIYSIATHGALHKVKSLGDLRQFSIISNRLWRSDWQTLQAMQIDKLHSAATMDIMIGMIVRGRVDFVLVGFSNREDLAYDFWGERFVPVPGFKVALKGTRHFAVSRSHPEGQRVYAALQKGLTALRNQGLITRAYREAGFFNQYTRDWTVIN